MVRRRLEEENGNKGDYGKREFGVAERQPVGTAIIRGECGEH